MNLQKPADARFGFMEADITPAYPTELVGFMRGDNRSKGVLHPLLLQAAVFERGKNRCCLLAIDSLGFTTGLSNQLRDLVAGLLRVARENVMLCFSHTHSAPNAALEPAYFTFVCEQARRCVTAAAKTMKPLFTACGVGAAELGVNRRTAGGALDKRIGVFGVYDGGKPLPSLLILRVTAHANVLSSDNSLISSDYFGAVRRRLQREYGCPVMVTQGASGNVRPRYQSTDAVQLEEHPETLLPASPKTMQRWQRESLMALDRMAEAAAEALAPVISALKPKPAARLALFSKTVVASSAVPDKECAEAIAAEARREAGLDGTAWLEETKRLRQRGVTEQTEDMEVSFFLLGDGCLCGVAAEIMCEIALDAAEKADSELFFLGGYTNGCTGYLPTAEEFLKGGYEVLWSYLPYHQYHGRVMPLRKETAEKLSDFAARVYRNERSFGPAVAAVRD